jgi:hypothetical protein
MQPALLDVAESYYLNRTLLHFREARTILDFAELDYRSYIDSSILAILCLADVPYESSPYAGHSFQKGKARWAVDYYAKGVRNTAQLCEVLTEEGYRLPLPSDTPYTYSFHNMKVIGVRPGDLVFYSKERNRRYLNITDVSIVRGFEEHPDYPILETSVSPSKDPFPLRYSHWEEVNSDIVAVCRPVINESRVF